MKLFFNFTMKSSRSRVTRQYNSKVIETEGVVKGQTAASSYKPALLERGIKTTVPQFIAINDRVVISTHDMSYIEKAKN